METTKRVEYETRVGCFALDRQCPVILFHVPILSSNYWLLPVVTSNSSSVMSVCMAQFVTNMATSTTAVSESDAVDTGSDPKETGADGCPHYWQSTIFHWPLLTSWRQFSSQPFQTVKQRSNTPASRQKQHALSKERLCCVSGEAGGPNASGAICMKEAFRKHSLPWNSCVGVSMDNTAVDMDKRNSIVS